MEKTTTLEGSPFHAGEQEVQERLGVRDIEDWARKVVRPFLPEQHREFHTSLPFLVAAAMDEQGRPWATLLTGPDGFITSPDPGSLVMDGVSLDGDPLSGALSSGRHLGLLGIELADRRRNRINGRVRVGEDDRLIFDVDQSFGNCPQYIREREWTRVENDSAGSNETFDRLTADQSEWIGGADTFFIASGYIGDGDSPTFGMDASHRGGEPGFVRVIDDKRIQFPDFAGNNHYNTLGNIVLNPKVGFLFVDFPTGSLLHLTGRASIDWESEAVAKIPGARRIVTFEIDEIRERRSAVPLRWEESADFVRSLRLVEKVRESEEITSFVFEARDGASLPMFEAGQYLPIELEVPGIDGPVSRTYSLSGPPSTERYRISVKREPKGIASRHLHDRLDVGAIIDARHPAGEDLMLPCAQCPVALISAGVGITPMMSLLHELAEEGGERPVWFIHGASDGARHVLSKETRDLADRMQAVTLHFAYSNPGSDETLGKNFDSEGRINGQLVTALVDAPDAHYLLCGPTGFMAGIQDALERKGVPPENIHTESFGPKA
jgi:uncharacterized protein